jgi:DNA ligase-1
MIDLDLVVMGADFGQGKKTNVLSSFLLGTQLNGKYIPIAKVGSGFSDL